MTGWSVIEELDNRIANFVGLGASDQQIRRLLDNWHIVSALASGRLVACLEEFVPVQREEGISDVDWDIWEEKLRHFPVTIDHSTPLRERAVRSGIPIKSVAERFLRLSAEKERRVETLRFKMVKNRKPVSDLELDRFLEAKLLKRARLAHLLEFVGQHPESVGPALYSPGTYEYSEIDGEVSLDLPRLEKEGSGSGPNRPEGFSLTVRHFKGGRGGVVYEAGSSFLVVRYPLPRDEDGRIIKDP